MPQAIHEGFCARLSESWPSLVGGGWSRANEQQTWGLSLLICRLSSPVSAYQCPWWASNCRSRIDGPASNFGPNPCLFSLARLNLTLTPRLVYIPIKRFAGVKICMAHERQKNPRNLCTSWTAFFLCLVWSRVILHTHKYEAPNWLSTDFWLQDVNGLA